MAIDRQRALIKGPDLFSRFALPRTATPLSAMHLPHQEQLLIFERGEEKRALLVRQMAYHHVAQGELAGEPFLVAFWMEIGLGVVVEQHQRFYPLAGIGAGLVDRWRGLRLHITVGPIDRMPQARFADGSRPFQIFTRWYGFAFTYPGCEIFGQ